MNLRIAHFAFYLLFAAYVLNVMTQKSYADAQATEKQSESSPYPQQTEDSQGGLQVEVEVEELKVKPKKVLTPAPTSVILSAVAYEIKNAQQPSKIYQLLNTPPPESAFSV